MKKLISILLATFFICTASYGATIKELFNELLGVQKFIKLLCKVEKAAFDVEEGIFVGSLISYEISKNKIYVNNEEWSDTIYRKNIPTINKNSISFFKKVSWGKFNEWVVKIEINRISGSFKHIEIKQRNPDDKSEYTIYEGICEKAPKNKF